MFRSAIFLTLLLSILHPHQIIEDLNPLEILSPSIAGRTTQKIILDNGLRAYIISDPNAHESSASLCVSTGFWDDPESFPGTAHLCEHTLFAGSEKYPSSNCFSQAVSNSNGRYGAFTTTDRTVYTFSCKNDDFNSILDIFSQLFISPTFNREDVEKEILSLDHEYQKNIHNNVFRTQMILMDSANGKHPISKFPCGNKASLRKITPEDLRSWFLNHYVAENMFLVVYSNESMRSLIKLVEGKFSKINKSLSKDERVTLDSLLPAIFSDKQRGSYIIHRSIDGTNSLQILWEIPRKSYYLDQKLGEVISYILGNEAWGSLVSYMKDLGFVDDLYFDTCSFRKDSSIIALMSVSLTENGLLNANSVIEMIYGTLNSLKNQHVPDHVFEEIGYRMKFEYQWQHSLDPYKYTLGLSELFPDEDLSTLPYKSSQMRSSTNPNISEFLGFMTPKRGVHLINTSLELPSDAMSCRANWLDCQYYLSPIDAKVITSWAEARRKCVIPYKNDYIYKHVDLVKEKGGQNISLLEKDKYGECYFLQDDLYQEPITTLSLKIKSPMISGNARSLALLDIFIDMLHKEITETRYQAKHAGINIHFFRKDLSLNLEISGVSAKVPKATISTLNRLKHLSNEELSFLRSKERIKKYYDSLKSTLLTRQGLDLSESLLFSDHFSIEEMSKVISDIEYQQYLYFAESLLDSTFLQGTIHGNLTKSDSEKLWLMIKSKIDSSPLLEINEPEILAVKGGKTIVLESEIPSNGAVLTIHSVDSSLEQRALLKVINAIVSDDFFNQIRTDKQVGYLVHAWAREKRNANFLHFAIQSSTHSTADLIGLFDGFINDFVKKIDLMVPISRYDNVKKAVMQSLNTPPENSLAMARHIHNKAYTPGAGFYENKVMHTHLQEVSYEDFKVYLSSLLTSKDRLYILLSGS